MPPLGEKLRFTEPILTENESAWHAEIDIATQALYNRMFELAPPAPKPPKVANYAFTSSEIITYPEKNPEMQARLRTLVYPKRARTTSTYRDKPKGVTSTEVMLYTRNLYDRGGWTPRVSAHVGKLALAEGWSLKTMSRDSATNILADIGDTLELFAAIRHSS